MFAGRLRFLRYYAEKTIWNGEKLSIDKIDRKILGILAIDGRRSYTELAQSVNLSANAVAERVKRPVRNGTIRHIRASIDPAALREFPQVRSAAVMTGSFDYALRVACADRGELFRLIEQLREKAGARETYSRMILHEVQLEGD